MGGGPLPEQLPSVVCAGQVRRREYIGKATEETLGQAMGKSACALRSKEG